MKNSSASFAQFIPCFASWTPPKWWCCNCWWLALPFHCLFIPFPGNIKLWEIFPPFIGHEPFISNNMGIAIINHPCLMVYTTHFWWLGGLFIIATHIMWLSYAAVIAKKTLNQGLVSLGDISFTKICVKVISNPCFGESVVHQVFPVQITIKWRWIHHLLLDSIYIYIYICIWDIILFLFAHHHA